LLIHVGSEINRREKDYMKSLLQVAEVHTMVINDVYMATKAFQMKKQQASRSLDDMNID